MSNSPSGGAGAVQAPGRRTARSLRSECSGTGMCARPRRVVPETGGDPSHVPTLRGPPTQSEGAALARRLLVAHGPPGPALRVRRGAEGHRNASVLPSTQQATSFWSSLISAPPNCGIFPSPLKLGWHPAADAVPLDSTGLAFRPGHIPGTDTSAPYSQIRWYV